MTLAVFHDLFYRNYTFMTSYTSGYLLLHLSSSHLRGCIHVNPYSAKCLSFSNFKCLNGARTKVRTDKG